MSQSSFFKLCFAFFTLFLCSCNGNKNSSTTPDNPQTDAEITFYFGADLSYVNEMEDCGAVYKNGEGQVADAYQIFKDAGANLVRLRLWHNPTWTDYSNFEDVKKSISRAKSRGMRVLLDFHYSDTWADPNKQEIPAAWLSEINNTQALSQLLYDYTFSTLMNLADDNLTPDIVQVGNEINPMILQSGTLEWPIDWSRNSALLNKGIQAVRDAASQSNDSIEVMLHIAQPENGLWWFEQATANGVTDFDWIGLSYYPVWSDYTLANVKVPLTTLIQTYQKRLMVVETAYPYTLTNQDPANNILGTNALVSGFPASQQGQLDYLIRLQQEVEGAGGEGLIYWEPAWVSTSCSTLWGQCSHWDNATLFDENKEPTLGLNFYNGSRDD